MSGRRSIPEARVLNEILADLGHEPDLLLLRNTLGAREDFDRNGKRRFQTWGLGTGSPDLVGILSIKTLCAGLIGVWFCLEVKAPGFDATPAQLTCHAAWRRFGAWVDVVHSAEEARSFLEQVRRHFA